MILHSYNHYTGEYIGQIDAPIDPLETAKAGRPVYFIPEACTEVAPPTLAEKQAAVWGGEDWFILADHRGETWYDAQHEPHMIAGLGDPTIDGLTAKSVPQALVEANGAKLAELRAAYSAARAYPTHQLGMQYLAAVAAFLTPGLSIWLGNTALVRRQSRHLGNAPA